MTTLEGRSTDARVTDCPARSCGGRALLTYDAHRFRSPAVRVIAEIACDRSGYEDFASAETVAAMLGNDPREANMRSLQ